MEDRQLDKHTEQRKVHRNVVIPSLMLINYSLQAVPQRYRSKQVRRNIEFEEEATEIELKEPLPLGVIQKTK